MESLDRGFYTVTKLSKNMYIDNDGTLVCTNAILGKAGIQKYVGYELGLDSSEIILVERPEHEVFKDESLSSLKGKALTLNHPDDDVSIENYKELSKGFIIDVRRDGNLMVGDIRITDPETIDLVRDKKMTELSLGYRTHLKAVSGNKLMQTNISYNHLALVRRGRAEVARLIDGKFTRVIDKQLEMEGETRMEKETGMISKILGALGLKKSEIDGKEVYVSDSEEPVPDEIEESETEEETEENIKDEKPETKVDDEGNEPEEKPEPKKEPDPSESDTEKETNILKDEDSEEEETVENKEPTVEKTLKDKGENKMDAFETMIARLKEIESFDEETKKTLKDSIMKEYNDSILPKEDKKVEDESNEMLESFGQLNDEQKEIYSFDKEYEDLLDSLNPHSLKYDGDYGKYNKARRQISKSASKDEIQKLVDETMGGNH